MSSVSDKEIEEANKLAEYIGKLSAYALHGNVDKLWITIRDAKKELSAERFQQALDYRHSGHGMRTALMECAEGRHYIEDLKIEGKEIPAAYSKEEQDYIMCSQRLLQAGADWSLIDKNGLDALVLSVPSHYQSSVTPFVEAGYSNPLFSLFDEIIVDHGDLDDLDDLDVIIDRSIARFRSESRNSARSSLSIASLFRIQHEAYRDFHIVRKNIEHHKTVREQQRRKEAANHRKRQRNAESSTSSAETKKTRSK